MRTITTFLFSIILLTLVSCDDKKENQKLFVKERNNTILFTKKDVQKYSNSKNISDVNHSKYTNTFTLKSSQKKSYKFSILDKHIYAKPFQNKTIILNISHINSPSSLDHMESLSKLQNKYRNSIIVISLLLGDTQKISTPNIFLNKHHIYHFVSFSKENEALSNLLYSSLAVKDKAVPLTVIYKKGKYYSHFETSTPIEMVTHDIKQTIKK